MALCKAKFMIVIFADMPYQQYLAAIDH
jgi:hypothetical protein